jgi:hypothetical protein
MRTSIVAVIISTVLFASPLYAGKHVKVCLDENGIPLFIFDLFVLYVLPGEPNTAMFPCRIFISSKFPFKRVRSEN